MNSPMTATAPASWRDYYEMCKPNVVLLMLLTSVIGMCMATPGMVPWNALIFGNLGIALTAASAAAVNHLVDRRIDKVMARTHNRPVAQGRIDTLHAVLFAAVLGISGMAVLILLVNQLTAWLTLASHVGYAVIYTLWLKRATPQNIVIGGAAGAFPPVIGWAAATGTVGLEPLLMFALIFLWTPPHFWALALFVRDDYGRAAVPMLTVTHGRDTTRRHILLYTLPLVPAAIWLGFTSVGGPVYLAVALGLNLWFLAGAWAVSRRTDADCAADSHAAERGLFKVSLVYLFAQFAALLVEATPWAAALRDLIGWSV